jgi:hypothetical protein
VSGSLGPQRPALLSRDASDNELGGVDDCAFKAQPLRNGGERKMFRKEVPRVLLSQWRKAWWLLSDDPQNLTHQVARGD